MPEICEKHDGLVPMQRLSFRWVLSGEDPISFPSFIMSRVEFERETMYVHFVNFMDMQHADELIGYVKSNSRLRLKLLDREGQVTETWKIDHEYPEAQLLPGRVFDYALNERVDQVLALKIRECSRL
jgi:hypothetical protein